MKIWITSSASTKFVVVWQIEQNKILLEILVAAFLNLIRLLNFCSLYPFGPSKMKFKKKIKLSLDFLNPTSLDSLSLIGVVDWTETSSRGPK
jgi:hypothetical protein